MKVEEPDEEWGGPWTEKKLNAFEKYVMAYLTIMNKHPYWKRIYFDGFAGSGERRGKRTKELLGGWKLQKKKKTFRFASQNPG